MVIVVSKIVVLTLGFVVFLLAAWGVVVPDALMKLVKSTMDQRWGLHFAVVVRLALGAALIGVAPVARFPVTFQVLGVITLIAAVGLAIAGPVRLRRFLHWWVERFSALANRLWLLFGMAFGAFLVYGVL